jgi:apolipoprotein N-acyltransferase
MGVLLYFCFAPLYLWFLLPVFFGSLMSICAKQTAWKGFLYGYAFGYTLYSTHFYWIKITVTHFNENAFPFVSLFPALYLGLYAGLCGMAFSLVSKQVKPLFYPLFFAFFWTVGELLLSTISYGLPWNLVGYATGFSLPLMQAASLGSVFLLSFLVVFVSTSLFYAPKERRLIPIALCTLLLWGGYGYQRLSTTQTEYEANAPIIRVIQTGIVLEDRDAHTPLSFIKKNKGLTTAAELNKAHLIVWPEWGAPTHIKEDKVIERFIMGPLTEEQFLITGTSDRDEYKNYNALALLNKKSPIELYHKNILVPFSEFIPFKRWLPDYAITVQSKLNQSFTHGTTPPHMQTPKVRFTPLICFEAVYPFYVAKHAFISDTLIQISNDYWLDDSYAAAQHFAMSRLRSIETGLPLIRAANTGTSGFIDAYGRIIEVADKYYPAVIDNPLPSKTKTPTLWMSLIGFYHK